MSERTPASDDPKPTLPRSSQALVGSVSLCKRHPGLQLDKLSVARDQKEQSTALCNVVKCQGDNMLLQSLHLRRRACFETIHAQKFEMATKGPLTLHLSRSGTLENAGIALHPVYGFIHLPGSGLKGLARAWAETVWAPKQVDPETAWRRIEEIFGWSAGSETHKRRWRSASIKNPEGSATGRIVFHDAWPLQWPRLELDIVNNHHGEYYAGNCAPGDWENPTPVYFLSIGADITFEFVLSDRHRVADCLLDQAKSWLQAALAIEGTGAKTAAGYGRFVRPKGRDAPIETPLTAGYDLRLASPAFLAGASQGAQDCTLRPATLRGLLRWWWRTMHAAHVGRDMLRRLEAAVWGDTDSGSPVRLSLEPVTSMQPEQHPAKSDNGFLRQHGIERRSRQHKVTQGLYYASYGMAEKRHFRWMMPFGAEWRLTFTARDGWFRQRREGAERISVGAPQFLEQAETALWLLARFGGAGSRSRKGFGSFDDIDIQGLVSLEDCMAAAARFRDACHLKRADSRVSDSPALEDARVMEVATPWQDPWFALDQTGETLQRFAKSLGDKEDRITLGLPRRIGSGSGAPPLRVDKIERHASPAIWSLATRLDKALTVRLIVFPASKLPDTETSRRVLCRLTDFAEKKINEEIKRKPHASRSSHMGGNETRRTSIGDAAPAGTSTGTRQTLEKRQIVEALLIQSHTKKGGWGAHHEPTGIKRAIQNAADVPNDAKDGDRVEVYVFSNDAFQWLTDKVRQNIERNRRTKSPYRGHPVGPKGRKR